MESITVIVRDDDDDVRYEIDLPPFLAVPLLPKRFSLHVREITFT